MKIFSHISYFAYDLGFLTNFSVTFTNLSVFLWLSISEGLLTPSVYALKYNPYS